MLCSYGGRRRFNRFDGREPRFDVKKPVELIEEYQTEIEDIGRRGDGIAGIEGFATFLPDTKQGEHAKFKVKRVGNRFAIGGLVEA